MSNSGRVYFSIRGDFNPSEQTQAIGIQPTSTSLAGERAAGKLPIFSSWNYSTAEIKDEFVDVYQLSSEIVSDLAAHADRIAAVVQEHDLVAVLQVVLWISSDEDVSTPAIGFDPEVISFLQRVGASIDIDTYID